MPDAKRPQHIWLITGEESGDQLGAKLMLALKERLGPQVRFGGVGGQAKAGGGQVSLFDLS